MKILHLTLKKKWFDMILAGIKTEEYREYKNYWIKRLIDLPYALNSFTIKQKLSKDHFYKYDVIIFKNGYSKNAPEMTIEFKGVNLTTGNTEWGAEEGKEYFVISLGKILSTKNISKIN